MEQQRRLVQALHRRHLRLGVVLRRIGQSRSAYYRDLKARGAPSLDTVARIADYVGVRRRDLLVECELIEQ